MEVLLKPKLEKEITASVSESATSEEVVRSMISKAECCVDHLCGCTNPPGPSPKDHEQG